MRHLTFRNLKLYDDFYRFTTQYRESNIFSRTKAHKVRECFFYSYTERGRVVISRMRLAITFCQRHKSLEICLFFPLSLLHWYVEGRWISTQHEEERAAKLDPLLPRQRRKKGRNFWHEKKGKSGFVVARRAAQRRDKKKFSAQRIVVVVWLPKRGESMFCA